MSWKIRHEGSPRSIEGLTLPQVIEGLRDGLWEPTDEVRGPQDKQWVALESHPQTAEIAADLEPPPPPSHGDETRLDMNPLIDVALVLLIFFILTTSYAAAQRLLEMPKSTKEKEKGPITISKAKIEKFTIQLKIRVEKGKEVVYVEDKPVDAQYLVASLRNFVKETRKTQLLIDADPDVSWEKIVYVQDAAKGAGIQRAHFLVK